MGGDLVGAQLGEGRQGHGASCYGLLECSGGVIVAEAICREDE